MFDATVVTNSLASGLLLGGMLALTALGLSITLGAMRLVNLAHGELLVGGAYLGYGLMRAAAIDPLIGLPLVGCTMGLLALPLHRAVLTPLADKGMEAQMLTMFGVAVVLNNLYLLGFSADTRALDTWYAARAAHLGPVTVPVIYLLGFAVALLIVGLCHLLLTRTRFGRELRAASSDADAARTLGMDVSRVHALAFALGAACAAMGGVLIGMAFSFNPASGGGHLLNSFTVVVLGGIGNIFGTLIAGLVLGVVQSLGAVVFGDGYRDLVGLLLFFIALALRPQRIAATGSR